MDDLETYRDYLRELAQRAADPQLAGKLDLSGVVQQTLLETHAVNGRWADWSEEQRHGWLRTVLAHNLCDEARKYTAAARDVDREESLADGPSAWLIADQTSPSGAAARAERLEHLTAALATLPDDQRRAVELHHLFGQPLSATAAALGKTVPAVVGLLTRGLRRLREVMGGEVG